MTTFENEYDDSYKKYLDWEKIYQSPKMIRYESPRGIMLEIAPERINNKRVWFVVVTTMKKIMDKEFKTKAKALAYAKAYMKKH